METFISQRGEFFSVMVQCGMKECAYKCLNVVPYPPLRDCDKRVLEGHTWLGELLSLASLALVYLVEAFSRYTA